MTYKDNQPTFNVNRKVVNFKDFINNVDSGDLKLNKMKRQSKPNSEDQQHIGNQRWKFNKVTRKWDDINPDVIDDKIDAIEDFKKKSEE